MVKDISYGKSAREKLIVGVNKVVSAVACTLGPKGRNVIIGAQYGSPQIVNDGVTIAKEIELEDPLENAGAQLLKEVSSKTNDAAGDGTTTASVLAQSIICKGLDIIDSTNPVRMKEGINLAVVDAKEIIKEMSNPVVGMEKLTQVASVSAGNNKEIGELIANAISAVGEDGVVTVEESNTLGTTWKLQEGMQIDKGYLSPYFITDQESQKAILENPFILCINKKINLITDLVPTLEAITQAGNSLLLIAEDVEGEALAAIVVNVIRKVLRCIAIKAPGFGNTRKAMLEDIAILTGGKIYTEELGIKLENIDNSYFGKALRVECTQNETTILVDDSNKEAVAERIKQLHTQFENADSDYEKEKISQRIAKLSGGVAVISVGAASEVELKERKLRIEDALNATRAAKEEGIVPGGGYALLKVQEKLRASNNVFSDSDIAAGYELLVNSLDAPMIQILENAGLDSETWIKNAKQKGLGINALTEEFVDLIEDGIVDPAKVTRSALENAASIAGMLLTTEAAVVEKRKEETSPQPAPLAGRL